MADIMKILLQVQYKFIQTITNWQALMSTCPTPKIPYSLFDALIKEIRDCECESKEACPASCYIDKPPTGIEITGDIARHLQNDISTAKTLMGKCDGGKCRIKRMQDIADDLISALGTSPRKTA